jgi:hypothetical protein
MLGFMFSEKETNELSYILKKELEEMILDMQDLRIDSVIREALEERYRVIFRIFSRMAEPKDLAKYAPAKRTKH